MLYMRKWNLEKLQVIFSNPSISDKTEVLGQIHLSMKGLVNFSNSANFMVEITLFNVRAINKKKYVN